MANSTGIVGNPYAGGNVVLNTTPFTTFYTNMLAHQQAQRDAFSKQMQEQGRSLTPAGMRSQDVGALMQAKNDWQSHWQQNKDAIQHPDLDNGKAWGESNDLYNKAMGLVGQSKNEAKIDALANKLRFDPVKSARVSKAGRDLLDKQSLPINDPKHVSLSESDLSSNMFDPKELNADEDAKLTKAITTTMPGIEDMSQRKYGTLNPDFTKNTTVVHVPTQEELGRAAAMGESLYNNGTLAGEVHKLINEHGTVGNGITNPIYDHYNGIIKKYYGKDIDIQHPEELATAMVLDRNANYRPHEGKPEMDWEAKKQHELEMKKQQIDYEQNAIRKTHRSNTDYDIQQHNNDNQANVLDAATPLADEMKNNPNGARLSKLPIAAADFLYQEGIKKGSKKIDANNPGSNPINRNITEFGVLPRKDGSFDLHELDEKDRPAKYLGTYSPQDINLGVNKGAKAKQQLLHTDAKDLGIDDINVGNGTPKVKPKKAADGLTTKAPIKNGTSWTISDDLQGASHDDGGINTQVNGQPVNAEGDELKIKSDDGKEAIIPKRWRDRVLKLFKQGNNDKISNIVKTLPKQPNVAEDGGLYYNDDDGDKKGLVRYNGGKTVQGSITPTGQFNALPQDVNIADLQKLGKDKGFRTDSNINFQTDLENYLKKNNPSVLDEIKQRFGDTASGKFADGNLGVRTLYAAKSLLTPPVPQNVPIMQPPVQPNPTQKNSTPGTQFIVNVRGDEKGGKGAYYFLPDKETFDKAVSLLPNPTNVESKGTRYGQATFDMNHDVFLNNNANNKAALSLLGKPYLRNANNTQEFIEK